MTLRETVGREVAPAYDLPLVPAVRSADFVFVSGQVGIDPATGLLVSDGFEAQVRQTLDNIAAILTAAQCRLDDVVKTTVWLTQREHFAPFNAIYGEYFNKNPPARSAVVSHLFIEGGLVEIEAIARIP